MKRKNILKEIEGVFIPPVKKYYLGKLKHGTPYFWPRGFNSTIFSFRKLKKSNITQEELNGIHNYHKESKKFLNLPMVRRSKDWIISLFGNYYWIQVGWPWAIHKNELGWKDKWNTPRFEWSPSFMIFFFKWQFCIWWLAPKIEKYCDDTYWEMILWWLYYSNKDLDKAKNTWGWVEYSTKESTWNEKYLL